MTMNFEHFGHWLDGGTQDSTLIYHLMMFNECIINFLEKMSIHKFSYVHQMGTLKTFFMCELYSAALVHTESLSQKL